MNIIQQLKDAEGNNIYPIAYAQGGVKMDLLWTNASPTSAFAAQTISLDLSDYKLLAIRLILATGSSDPTGALKIIEVPYSSSRVARLHQEDGANHIFRKVTSISASGITFGEGVLTNGQANNYAIPYQIYGIKAAWIVPTSVHGMQYVEV